MRYPNLPVKLSLDHLEDRNLLSASPFDLSLIGRYDTGFGDTGSEIVAHDPVSQRLFIVHGIDDPADTPASSIEIVSLANPSSPAKVGAIDIASYGRTINSAAFKNGVLAVAVEAAVKTDPGKVVFFTSTGTYLNQVTVGALPDMLTFTPNGNYVLVANEGEPNSYNQVDSVDPVGSVSIINLSSGVANASVATAGFTAYIGQEAALRAQGIRIYGPNANAAQDFEPEYITTDGATAWVTLQENNALAIINVASATVSQLVPLGYKNWNVSSPFSESYSFNNLPTLGVVNGETIGFGGFSGLYFEGYDADGNMKFRTHTDRGPNGEPVGINRPFLIPTFTPEIVRFTLNRLSGEMVITQRMQLKNPNGTLLTGLSNINFSTNANLAYNDEVPTDANFTPLDTLDPLGGDFEGIVVDPNDGSFWMCDEYRAAIYHFNTTGVMINRYIPIGTHAAEGVAYTPGTFGTYGTEVLPAVIGQRRQNRGFEAIAWQNGKLYAMVQSPLRNPTTSSNTALNARQTVRLVEFDPVSLATRQFLYRMDNVGLGATRADKIGDMVAVPGGGFLVVERDDDYLPVNPLADIEKKVYRFDLTGATPITAANDILYTGKTLDEMTAGELTTAGITPIAKSLHTDLALSGYNKVSKVEGLAYIDAGTIAVINDNDFQVGAANEPVILGLIRTNGLDASDRDVPGASNNGIINIRNWPVFGMYQPDAVSHFVSGGQTFLITANEGDARDYTGFAEEARVGALDLDNTLFPTETFLKNNDNLGRLTVTTTLGNADGDGDYEQLYTLGGRSFSIWSSTGQLVFDSGSDLEVLTSQLVPGGFNSDGTSASFDTRSDNKGPEPEGVTVGIVAGKPYAFLSLERTGGVFAFDLSDPTAPKFVSYLNTGPTDLAPEGIVFISAADSPIGRPLILIANEVSGTVSIIQVNETDLVYQAPIGGVANQMVLRTNGADLELIDGATNATLLRQALSVTDKLTITGVDTETETLTIDFAFGGKFTLPGGVQFLAGSLLGDGLSFAGTADADNVLLDGSTATFGSLVVNTTGVDRFDFDAGEGDDQFTVMGQPTSVGYTTLMGNAGNDTYQLSTTGARLRLIDTSGVDLLDFSNALAGIRLDLGKATGQNQKVDGLANQVQLNGLFENLTGTEFTDTLSGNNLINIILGLAGNDTIWGLSGNDLLDGGAGNDKISGDAGNDILLGREGNDQLHGDAGRDLLIGGTGHDHLFGRNGSDILIGGSISYDDDAASLAAVLSVWTSDQSFSKRVKALSNGLLSSLYLINDNTNDLLVGGSNLDWKLA
jgi:Ca2+-binding RTX toxin-like protein